MCKRFCHRKLFIRKTSQQITIGISLPSCIEAEMLFISYLLPVNGGHLLFLTLWPTSHSIDVSLNVFPDPDNVGIAFRMLLLSCVEAKIPESYLLPVYGRHIDFRVKKSTGYSHQLHRHKPREVNFPPHLRCGGC